MPALQLQLMIQTRWSGRIFIHRRPRSRRSRRQGRCSGAGAVLVAVPGGSVAYVLGAVAGIESKAVIDGTSLSGAMSQDRFAFSSAHQGAPQPGAEIRELPAVPALRALGWPAIILRQRNG
jgi:hypothetical protein